MSGFSRTEERCYPLGGAAFHLLGDVRDGRNWSASNTAYIERDAQDRLRGFDDHATTVKVPDASGQLVPTIQRDYRELIPLLRHRYSPSQSEVKAFLNRSRDITLTIDAPLQASVANILSKYAARSATGHAAAVVINPDTGDLLAIGSYPFPTLPANRTAEREDETESVIDRARFGLYPPGSTFKLVTASAALRQNLALRDSTFMCSLQGNGRVGAQSGWDCCPRRCAGQKAAWHDRHARWPRALVQRLLCPARRSSRAPVDPRYRESARHLRRSRRFRVPPSRDAASGRLRPGRRRRHAASHGASGRGDCQRRHPPRHQGRGRNARVHDTQVLLTPGAATTLGRYLRDSVLSGTGRSLRGHPWRIAGKTGTAEVHDAQSHAWFVGYAPYGPAEKRVAFAVLIENAGYGGSAAAPAAGEIVSAAAASGLK